MDGWSGTVEHGPIPAYGRLDAARTWLVDVNRDHESEDASPREIFHTIERQYRPDGRLGFLAGLEES